MNMKITTAFDAQGLSFVQAQAYRINATVIKQKYPSWDFSDFVYVETEGNPWAPGVLTYTSDESGKAKFLSTYAKDMPFADVSQDMMLKSFHLAGIGYQYNIGEVNTTLAVVGGTLPSRRATAARGAYQRFMYETTLFGQPEKGLQGLTNYAGVPTENAAANGTGGVTWWVNDAGVGTKTPAQIVADINRALTGVSNSTFGTVLANTLLLPEKALDYISQTPYSATTMETILSFVVRTNSYTLKTGQQLRIRGLRELNTAGAGGTGRLVAYYDAPEMVKLHLPMPHQFLNVYPDGWANFVIPGIFRTGGIEFLAPTTAFYMDGIVEDEA